jgi:D-glycero-beta-D-manno-heptose 1-phosphate adenylyltransferase
MTKKIKLKQPDNIVFTPEEIEKRVAEYRKQGKKIVLTQGSFDLVHIGHARYCRAAKECGDVLIVGVDSDAKVKHRKGPDRPVVPQEERLEMLTHFSSVDLVILKQLEWPKLFLITTIRPDVLVATKERYTPEQVTELEKYCGQVVVLEPMATTSTSAKLRRLQIGITHNLTQLVSDKLQVALEEIFKELRGEK